jgi:hypothetical protein
MRAIFLLPIFLAMPVAIAQDARMTAPKVEAPTPLTKRAYTRAVERKLDNWEQIISNLRKTAAKTVAYESRRAKVKALVQDLEEESMSVKNELEDLKAAKEGTWQAFQGPIEARLDKMSKTYERFQAE